MYDDPACELCGVILGEFLNPPKRRYCSDCRTDYGREIRAVTGGRVRAIEQGAPLVDLTVKEWVAVLDAWERCCAYCDRPYEGMEHIIPLSSGGGHTQNNVVPACHPCNRRKSTGLLSQERYYDIRAEARLRLEEYAH